MNNIGLCKLYIESPLYILNALLHRKPKLVPFNSHDEHFLPRYPQCSLSDLGLRAVSLKSRRRPEHRSVDPSCSNALRLTFQPGLYETAYKLLRQSPMNCHTALDIGSGPYFLQSHLYPGRASFCQRFNPNQTTLIGLDWISFVSSLSGIGHALQFDIVKGKKLPFRSGVFDCIISISTIQWLLGERNELSKSSQNIYNFFSEIYRCSSLRSEIVIQFYPSSLEDLVLVFDLAKEFFCGGLVVEYPFANRGAKLFFYLYKIE